MGDSLPKDPWLSSSHVTLTDTEICDPATDFRLIYRQIGVAFFQ